MMHTTDRKYYSQDFCESTRKLLRSQFVSRERSNSEALERYTMVRILEGKRETEVER